MSDNFVEIRRSNHLNIEHVIVSILDSCCAVKSEEDFKLLIKGKLRAIIPNAMVIVGIVDLWRFNLVNYINLGYPESYIDRTVAKGGGHINNPLIYCWKKKYQPFYVNDLSLLSEIDPNWASLARANSINNFLVHGIVDISGKYTSFISFANSPTGWTPRHCQLLELVLPSLHVALNRVLKSKPVVEDKFVKLSIREAEILKLLHGGKTNKQIANILGISDNTVRNHIQNVFEKMGVNNRAMAVAKAVSQRLIYV